MLAVDDLCVHDFARLLGIDLGVEALAREAADLGLVYSGSDRAMRWTLGRLALHQGPRPVTALRDNDIDEFLVAVRVFGERSDLGAHWTSSDRYRLVSKAWITMIGQLRLVLYHRRQVDDPPRKIMQFDGGEETDFAAMTLDGLDAERRCDMGFAGFRAADQDHVPRTIDELAAVQCSDSSLLDLAGSVVEAREIPVVRGEEGQKTVWGAVERVFGV